MLQSFEFLLCSHNLFDLLHLIDKHNPIIYIFIFLHKKYKNISIFYNLKDKKY